MNKIESNAWVFDSLVGFLHGPVWNIPLQTFVEEKSLPFEPSESAEVIDKPEYKLIHEEYKNLVDVMLGSFMDDLGISAEQLEAACAASRLQLDGLPMHFQRRLFEQIWAANDYAIFVKMMTRKNVELQLQALELIERRFGMVPSLFQSGGESGPETPRADYSDDSDGDDVLTQVKNLKLDDVVDEPPKLAPERLTSERKMLRFQLHTFGSQEAGVRPGDTEDLAPDEKPVPLTEASSPVDEAPLPIETDPAGDKKKISDEEIAERREYLRRQRDKLLSLKKQVREKQLEAGDGDHGGSSKQAVRSRPVSARAAQAILSGQAPPAPAADAMKIRQALVDRLKAEVVYPQK